MSEENNLLKEIMEYTEIFNNLCEQIGKKLKTQIPKNRDIHIYNEAICDVIKKNPSEPISVFIMKVYADDNYRKSILEANEDFFMNSNHESFAKNDPKNTDIIVQVKKCWSELNGATKKFITKAFETMINLCEIYIEKKDDLNKLLKKKK